MNELPIVLDIDVYTDHPAFHEDDPNVAASIDVSKLNLPKRQVISKDVDKIKQWMIDDFDSFMDTVESICEESYGLVSTYKKISSDHSYYYNYLATDDEGNIIIDFRLRLRVSNHEVKRSKGQKQNKKKEVQSPEIQKLLNQQEISRLKPYAKIITVNGETYDSYDEAMEHVDSVIGSAVETMKKRA